MMKFVPLIITSVFLVGCGSGSGSTNSGGSGGGSERGDINDRPFAASDSDYTISIIEYKGEDVFRTEMLAFSGFPMEIYLLGAQSLDYEFFEIQSAEGCGGVRRLNPEDDSGWETINNVPGNCTVTVNYQSTLKTDFPHLVNTEVSGYGASVSPALLSVPDGGQAHLFLNIQDGYEAVMSGCGGQMLTDRYVIDSVGEDCTVHTTVTPISSQLVSITTSAMPGARIKPEVANVNAGDIVRFSIDEGVGFEVTAAGCGGTLIDGIYQFTAAADCTVSVESYPEQDVPIIFIEATGGESVMVEVQVNNDDDYSYVRSVVPEVALLDNISFVRAQLKRPNKAIISSATGCYFNEESLSYIYAGLELYRKGDELIVGEGPEEALDQIETDCTWTLSTEPSSYRKFGISKLDVQLLNNEGYDGYQDEKFAFNGTASQFIVDEAGYEFYGVSGPGDCTAERTESVVTVYHGQNYFKDVNDVEYGELPELCTAGVLMHSNDYVGR
ncbi:hypothetical protein [Gilvimarinus polysaccharolyticus]|uniref:hypothetical protein n=1 Tax=Gilvimarinus polysaccharolyticus TaxID=863921 RepID=UPI000673433C|nr:hypothetical protein [Gilvimarinus polysaccharolyticus]